MTQRVDFRHLTPAEIDVARVSYKQKYPWAAEPNWAGVWARFEDGKVVGMFEVQSRITVGLLDAATPADGIRMIERVDSYLAALGVNQYEFIVPDTNPVMQKGLTTHYGLEGQVEVPHKLYFVKRGQ